MSETLEQKPGISIRPRTGIDPVNGLESKPSKIPPESLVEKAMGFARRALGKINTQKPRNTPF